MLYPCASVSHPIKAPHQANGGMPLYKQKSEDILTKRHLTKQQRRRIQQNQAKARAEAQTQRESDEHLSSSNQSPSKLSPATLGPEQDGRVIASYGTQVDVEPESPSEQSIPTVRRCHLRANLPTIITGDKVTWQDSDTLMSNNVSDSMGVVTAQHPRHSELCRPDSRGKLRPVAANIDRIAIVVAPYPEPHANLIDRYLVAAEHQSIQPIVILNKADLIDDNNYEILTGLLDCYIKLGYDCFLTSAQSGEGIESIEDYLEGLTSVFVGQSGVGKSSLLNTLSPDINTPVGALSVSKAKGTHTTTNSQLFHLPNGGDVIDSPGIREFGLWHLAPPSIAEGFIELRPFIGQCKFRDCQHQKEPSCAFKQAVDDGNISKKRFDSYWHMINSLEQES